MQIKKWLKKKIGIDDLQEQFDELQTEVKGLRKARNVIQIELEILDNKIKRVLESNKGMRKYFDIGVDVNQRGSSWAILCVRTNKGEIIKEIRFPDDSAQHVMEMIKTFEGSNRIVDKPMGMRI